MAHKTLGIEIGAQQIHLAVCTVDGNRITLEEQMSAHYSDENDKDGESLETVLQSLSEKLYSDKRLTLEAIGMTLDSTLTLSSHEILPFSDPKIIENTIYTTMADKWSLTDDSMIAFRVGDYVRAKTEDDIDGYDVFVLHASKKEIESKIQKLAPCRLEPHVVLPELQAFDYVLDGFVQGLETPCVILDMGASKTRLYAINASQQVTMSRVFKLGGKQLDEMLAKALRVSTQEAEEIKCSSGFVASAGMERACYERFVRAGRLVPTDVDPMVICQACQSGLNLLFTSIYQSLVLFTSSGDNDVQRMYLTGNASHLAGLDDWLTQQLGIPCSSSMTVTGNENVLSSDFSFCAIGAAIAASRSIDGDCPLNLRKGSLAHKGSLEYVSDNKWFLLALVVLLAISGVFSLTSHVKAVNAEYDQLKQAVEKASMEVFGKKITSLKEMRQEVEASQGYSFIPARTAFTHFEWLSNKIHETTDMDMELSQLDIDMQRKIVTLRGEVGGDDGLPKFLQLLEQYECFPDEIAEPRTSKVKERTAFTLRVEATNCSAGGSDE